MMLRRSTRRARLNILNLLCVTRTPRAHVIRRLQENVASGLFAEPVGAEAIQGCFEVV